MVAPATISDRVVAHLRGKGEADPIAPETVSAFLVDVSRTAANEALFEAGGEPGAIHPQHWIGFEDRMARILQRMVDQL